MATWQEALYREWVLEAGDSLRISQVALEVTQQSLVEARERFIRCHCQSREQEEALQRLPYHLNQAGSTSWCTTPAIEDTSAGSACRC